MDVIPNWAIHFKIRFMDPRKKKQNNKFTEKNKRNKTFHITHMIHGAGIYANIWGILMVHVTIYSIHGSYG